MVKRAEIKGFYTQCSPERCNVVDLYVHRVADKEVGIQRNMIGGLEGRVLEPARLRGIGTKREYTLGERRGLPLEFRRCFKYDFVNDRLLKEETATCTDVATYSVPYETVACYKKIAKVLEKLRPVKRGRPAKKGREQIGNEALALAGCSVKVTHEGKLTHVEYQAITPSIVALVTGNKLSASRNAINNLVYQGKLVGEPKPDDERTKNLLRVLSNEKTYIMPKPYAVAFDQFIKGEEEERIYAGIRRVFGKDFIAMGAPEVPKGLKRRMRAGAEIIREADLPESWREWKEGEPMPEGFQMSMTAKARAEAEEEAWRRRTRIRQPRYRRMPVLGSEAL